MAEIIDTSSTKNPPMEDEMSSGPSGMEDFVQVFEAKYYNVYITEQVQRLVLEGETSFQITPETFGIPDPIYGTQKTLTVTYFKLTDEGPQRKIVSGKDFEIMTLN